MKPDDYLGATTDELRRERADLVARMADLHFDLGHHRAQEVIAKKQGWANSREQTTTGRERDAQAQAYSIVATIREEEGELASLAISEAFLKDVLSERSLEDMLRG